MEVLDGNAIAGDLYEYFGVEMTTASGACAHCGAVSQIAQLRVYARAPGAVARCSSCGAVVLVVLGVRGSVRVELAGFELREPPSS
jgi:hypothetical protein